MLAESRMMVPDCHKRLEFALADLKDALVSIIITFTFHSSHSCTSEESLI